MLYVICGCVCGYVCVCGVCVWFLFMCGVCVFFLFVCVWCVFGVYIFLIHPSFTPNGSLHCNNTTRLFITFLPRSTFAIVI